MVKPAQIGQLAHWIAEQVNSSANSPKPTSRRLPSTLSGGFEVLVDGGRPPAPVAPE
jgi:hypothetical protein